MLHVAPVLLVAVKAKPLTGRQFPLISVVKLAARTTLTIVFDGTTPVVSEVLLGTLAHLLGVLSFDGIGPFDYVVECITCVVGQAMFRVMTGLVAMLTETLAPCAEFASGSILLLTTIHPPLLVVAKTIPPFTRVVSRRMRRTRPRTKLSFLAASGHDDLEPTQAVTLTALGAPPRGRATWPRADRPVGPRGGGTRWPRCGYG